MGVRHTRNEDFEDEIIVGHPISEGKDIILHDDMLQAAHRYMLFNTTEVEPYLQ